MTKEFDKRNAAKSRKVCEAMAEAASTGKRVLTERERAILDMWPRFEDGELVMVGDRVGHPVEKVDSITILESAFVLCDDAASSAQYERGQCVKRPVQSVLDADGVEIKVCDTVWYRSLCTMGSMRKAMVTGFDENCLGGKLATLKDEAGKTWYIDPKKITHVQHDSWERLEEDAADLDDMPCDFNAKDLIRRAKALAGVEVEA